MPTTKKTKSPANQKAAGAKAAKTPPTKKLAAKANAPKAPDVKAAVPKVIVAAKASTAPEEILFVREYWTGDSRDGVLVNGDGYHFFRMTKPGKIVEAYEFYELDDGRECVTPCPDMISVHWIDDLGYEDFEILDVVHELEFIRIKNIANGIDAS